MTALRSEWGGIRRWRERATWAGRKLRAAPAPVRILAIAVIAFLGFFAINLFYHVLRKPTEIFAFVSANFNKAPAETWRQYGRLFREYSTAAISPELLAALAQVEVGSGVHPGGGGTERLPPLVGRGRALEIVLGSNDFDGETAERYGYVNRSLPDRELDDFVDKLARRIASFDRRPLAARMPASELDGVKLASGRGALAHRLVLGCVDSSFDETNEEALRAALAGVRAATAVAGG